MLVLNVICVFEEGNYLFIYYVLNVYLCKSCLVKLVWSCFVLISVELVFLLDDGIDC